MTCTRCQGCMAKDYFIDLMESAESMWAAGWRCLNCGSVLDPVMERNRRGQGMAAVISPPKGQAITGSGLKKKSMSSQTSRPDQPGHQSR